MINNFIRSLNIIRTDSEVSLMALWSFCTKYIPVDVLVSMLCFFICSAAAGSADVMIEAEMLMWSRESEVVPSIACDGGLRWLRHSHRLCCGTEEHCEHLCENVCSGEVLCNECVWAVCCSTESVFIQCFMSLSVLCVCVCRSGHCDSMISGVEVHLDRVWCCFQKKSPNPPCLHTEVGLSSDHHDFRHFL